ncbi:12646_t:CDS:2 [Entrophospora sp. SA101]|nr:12646_t:CDS:2 [Entrophospora sp. SA101]
MPELECCLQTTANKKSCYRKYYYNLKFEGFEDYLDKNNLTLISILRFRSIKQDFTYNKSAEHALISKFLSYIAQISKDEKWIMVANKLKKDGMLDQTQNEEVKRFWLDVEIERGEFQMKQTEIQFIVDRSISNNKTHDLIEEQNLNFISNYEMQTLNSGEFIKTTKTISEDTNTYSEEDGENDLEVIEHVGENLTEFEIKISGKLTTILRKAQEKEKIQRKHIWILYCLMGL